MIADPMLETPAALDDRPEPADRAQEQPSPWDREPAEERDALWHTNWQAGEDW